jgi:hypothetical protein
MMPQQSSQSRHDQWPLPKTEATDEKHVLKGGPETPQLTMAFPFPELSMGPPCSPRVRSFSRLTPNPFQPRLRLSTEGLLPSLASPDPVCAPSQSPRVSTAGSSVYDQESSPLGESAMYSREATIASELPILRGKASLYRLSKSTPTISQTAHEAKISPASTQFKYALRTSPSLTRFPIKPQGSAAFMNDGPTSSSTRVPTNVEQTPQSDPMIDDGPVSFLRRSAERRRMTLSSLATTDNPSGSRGKARPMPVYKAGSSALTVFPSIDAATGVGVVHRR